MKKEQIIDNCGKIHFYSCVREYFEYNEQVSDEVAQFLLKQNDILYQLLETVYQMGTAWHTLIIKDFINSFDKNSEILFICVILLEKEDTI